MSFRRSPTDTHGMFVVGCIVTIGNGKCNINLILKLRFCRNSRNIKLFFPCHINRHVLKPVGRNRRTPLLCGITDTGIFIGPPTKVKRHPRSCKIIEFVQHFPILIIIRFQPENCRFGCYSKITIIRKMGIRVQSHQQTLI